MPESAGPSPPLVVVLHGCTQDADQIAAATRFHAWGEREGFAVLYPNQPEGAHPQRCWRWFDAEHQRAEVGEPGALMDLVERVTRAHGLDRDSTYVAGLSAGAGMAVVLATLHPDRFGGVAAHSGVPYAAARSEKGAAAVLAGNVPPPAALASRMEEATPDGAGLPRLLAIHGTGDQVVSPENGRRLAAAWLAARGRPSAAPDRTVEGEGGDAPYPYRRHRWTAGDAPPVEAWLIEGLGHAWSGGDPAGTWVDPAGPDATRAVLRFFGLLEEAPGE